MFAARRCGKHRLSAKYEYKTQTIQRCDSLSRVSSVEFERDSTGFNFYHGWIQRGDRGPDPPPWKITSYIGFYMESAIAPPPPLEIVGPPPPPLENIGSPLEPRKMIVFYESNRWSSVK